jgi:hypothetical protein
VLSVRQTGSIGGFSGVLVGTCHLASDVLRPMHPGGVLAVRCRWPCVYEI